MLSWLLGFRSLWLLKCLPVTSNYCHTARARARMFVPFSHFLTSHQPLLLGVTKWEASGQRSLGNVGCRVSAPGVQSIEAWLWGWETVYVLGCTAPINALLPIFCIFVSTFLEQIPQVELPSQWICVFEIKILLSRNGHLWMPNFPCPNQNQCACSFDGTGPSTHLEVHVLSKHHAYSL